MKRQYLEGWNQIGSLRRHPRDRLGQATERGTMFDGIDTGGHGVRQTLTTVSVDEDAFPEQMRLVDDGLQLGEREGWIERGQRPRADTTGAGALDPVRPGQQHLPDPFSA